MESNFFQKTIRQVLDFVYPPNCEICQTPLADGIHLCQPCLDLLPRIQPPFCEHCGEMYDGNIDGHFICPNCSTLHYEFAFCRPVLQSSEGARNLIHKLKYGKAVHLAADLARITAEAFSDPRLERALLDKWTLIPVPLHWSREQTRYFNQSLEITKHLSRILRLPWCDALKRLRSTKTQTALNRKHRLKNLKDSFSLSSKGKKWQLQKPAGAILIDDVFTTGATAQECSSVLRKNGIENRVVVTLMRG